jgi:hypothetical protein
MSFVLPYVIGAVSNATTSFNAENCPFVVSLATTEP